MGDAPTRRGRPARTVPAAPTGYRCTADVRRELQVAMAFLGEFTMQSVIDRAVADFLTTLHSEVTGFSAAVVAARPVAARNAAPDAPER